MHVCLYMYMYACPCVDIVQLCNYVTYYFIIISYFGKPIYTLSLFLYT